MNTALSDASQDKAAKPSYEAQQNISSHPHQKTMDAPQTPSSKPARTYPRLDTSVQQQSDAVIDTGSTSPVTLRSPPAFLTMSQQLAEGDAYLAQALSVRSLMGKDDFENELHSKVPESPATSESPSRPLGWRSLFGRRE